MAEDIISELRQVLQEVIVPDLKLLVAKIDDLQRCIELSNRTAEARFDALRLEVEAMRSEMKTMRDEMNHLRAALGSQAGSRLQTGPQENSVNGDEQTAGPDGPGKRWVN